MVVNLLGLQELHDPLQAIIVAHKRSVVSSAMQQERSLTTL